MDSFPTDLRTSYGIKPEKEARYIVVFDVPTLSKSTRLGSSLGPSGYPLEMLERFYEDLSEALQKFSQLRLILKPKRALTDPRREYPRALWRLLDPESAYHKQGRVVILPDDIDPYLPIAMADLCIGLPFTSPILVALRYRRDGFFHDPLGTVRVFRLVELESLITHNRRALLERLQMWINKGENHVGDSFNVNLEHWLGPPGEPTVRFAQLLKQPDIHQL
jgi:polysaccharide biosynthesis PFTS motif protein